MFRSLSNPLVRFSTYHLPTLREDPQEAVVVSHRYMLRAGMISQSASGIYSWLPLGLRVLKKIEQIVREEQDRAGAHEVLMATIQTADLWRESGRYDDYGKEMLRIRDRHDRDLLYGPTNEEVITALIRESVQTYRDLPRLLYHIQWKFRDELRPRFGVMRGREFFMKDGYSFDVTPEDGVLSYNRMFVSYLRTFARMGLKAVPMRADTGPIGGDASHEFTVLAQTGENEVYCDQALLELDPLDGGLDIQSDDMTGVVQAWTRPYACSDEQYDPQTFEAQVPEARRVVARGIEVGHVFFFGDKYSRPMKCAVTDRHGEQVYVQSGSYGIGISRLVGAIIEACHDDDGILWPEVVAPFAVTILNLKPGDKACDEAVEQLAQTLVNSGRDVAVDDRELRPGEKFADADLIGTPWQVIVGPRDLATGTAVIKTRKDGQRQSVALADIPGVILQAP